MSNIGLILCFGLQTKCGAGKIDLCPYVFVSILIKIYTSRYRADIIFEQTGGQTDRRGNNDCYIHIYGLYQIHIGITNFTVPGCGPAKVI